MSRQPIDWSSLSDDDFVERAETQIWLSAFAANNPRAPAHAETDAAYADAKRREKPWLYCKAYNRAVRSAGHEVSDDDRASATEEGYRRLHPDFAAKGDAA